MRIDLIHQAYEIAKDRYATLGVDTEMVLNQLQDFHLSLHCWQADDLVGFEPTTHEISGGIQRTGNYLGRARNIDELRQDIEKAKSLIPGNHRLNLHAIYGDFKGQKVDRNEINYGHFLSWMQWSREHHMPLDFNCTNFSHPKSGSLTLSNPNNEIRAFWTEHVRRCRKIANTLGECQHDPCVMNLWIHDGVKDLTVNRLLYRQMLEESLDQIYVEKYPWVKDSIEAKLFGIGLETMTVGSYDFYVTYAVKHQKMMTLDLSQFHATEQVADKISALMMHVPELMIHLSRAVRWASDHVPLMDDNMLEVFQEIIRSSAIHRVRYALDYFDPSINRVGAYVIGSRAAQKCMLRALLEPTSLIHGYELAGQGFQKLALLEECKSLPWNAVYDEFCLRNDMPVGSDIITEIELYERKVLSKRL